MGHAIILCSGGLDSVVLAYYLKKVDKIEEKEKGGWCTHRLNNKLGVYDPSKDPDRVMSGEIDQQFGGEDLT